jgi:hypothetical protein
LEPAKAGFALSLDKREDFVNAINKALEMDSAGFSEWSHGARKYAENFLHDASLLQKSIDLFEFAA